MEKHVRMLIIIIASTMICAATSCTSTSAGISPLSTSLIPSPGTREAFKSNRPGKPGQAGFALQQIPGYATDIAADGGSVWILGTTPVGGGYQPYQWNGGTGNGAWNPAPGGGIVIADGSNGAPWLINNKALIYRYIGNGNYQRIPGGPTDISAGDNAVWILGTNAVGLGYQPYKWNGGTGNGAWDGIAGGGVVIAVDSTGKPWVINNQQKIYRYLGHGHYQQMPGAATDIAAGGGKVWALGTNHYGSGYQLYLWNGSIFVPYPAGGKVLAVDSTGMPWLIDGQKHIWRTISL